MNIQNDENLKTQGVRNTTSNSASKDFEDFIYLLSHDVRNSVRALLELPQWIREDLEGDHRAIGDSLRENLNLMDVHTRRLDRMLIDLLAYSRVGRNQNVCANDLSEALQNVVDQTISPHGFSATYDLQCDTVHMGEQDLMTLLTAVLSNVVKHHHRRKGAVDVTIRKEDGECVICIQDDGPGIPEKHRERVFNAMTLLKSRDVVEGSGMGLAIARKVVDSYDGAMQWVTPKDGFSLALEIRIPD